MATASLAETISIEKIIVAQGFNVRDMSTEENRTSLATLTQSIKDNGLFTPLQGYYDEQKQFILTRGHRRLQAMQSLAWNTLVPVILDGRAETEEERVAGILLDNSGKALGPLEAAEVFARLKKLGKTQDAIAKMTGVTPQTVSTGLKVLSIPSAVVAIKKNLTTHTEAYECVKVLEARGEKMKQVEAFFKTQVDAAKPFTRKVTEAVAEPAAPYLSSKARAQLLNMVTNLVVDETASDAKKFQDFTHLMNAFCKEFEFDPHNWYRMQEEKDADQRREDAFKETEAEAKIEARAEKAKAKDEARIEKADEKKRAILAKAMQGNRVLN